jgi:hypothetical protein
MTTLLFQLLFLLSVVQPDVHDFHVSKCVIDFRPQEKALQISLHLFIDDLEEALRQQGHHDLLICTERESAQAETYIQNYLTQRLQLFINGKSSDFTFIGKEISDDLSGVWCYLEVTGVEVFNRIRVKNTLLFEIFDDQKNIVSIMGPNHRSTLLFQEGQEWKAVEF